MEIKYIHASKLLCPQVDNIYIFILECIIDVRIHIYYAQYRMQYLGIIIIIIIIIIVSSSSMSSLSVFQ